MADWIYVNSDYQWIASPVDNGVDYLSVRCVYANGKVTGNNRWYFEAYLRPVVMIPTDQFNYSLKDRT